MKRRSTSSTTRHAAKQIRQRIEDGGERIWRFHDFRDLPPSAVAQALSRMARRGQLRRLSKGIYYKPRQTQFGDSVPNPAVIHRLASETKQTFPAALGAANLLGFSTQAASRREVATTALSLPRKLVGAETIVHARRPAAWAALSAEDAALLDFLRRRGITSDLPEEETIARTLALFRQSRRFQRLLRVADSEPPRVRAMLGAIGEEIGVTRAALRALRASLNPLSRFDFGALNALRSARRWQVKECRAA
jgi:hypothetical protein